MNVLNRPGQCGTMESNDLMVQVAPAEQGSGIAITLVSPMVKQYGKQIEAVVKATLEEMGVADALVQVTDKGALDCTIRARVRVAAERAMQKEAN